MNFYKRFIGDIQSKTGALSLAEFGAYDRLLDHYYSTEKPVPQKDVYRICRAMTGSERAAVDRVLAEFFVLSAEGFSQSKADEVIAKAQPLIEAARANGKKGGRPPKPKTQTEPTGFSEQNPDGTQTEPSAKASQSQSQNSPSLRSGESRASRLPKPFELPDDWRDFCLQERPDLDPAKVAEKFADYWHGKPGKAGTKLDWLATWRNWVREERAPKLSAVAGTGVSFAERDREAGMARWEQMTGRVHPDRATCATSTAKRLTA